MSIVLRFFPNGEFAQGVDSSQKRKNKSAAGLNKKLSSPTRKDLTGYLDIARDRSLEAVSFDTPGYQFENVHGHIYTYLYKDVNGVHHLACESDTFVLEDVQVTCPMGIWCVQGGLTPLGLSDARILSQASRSRKRLVRMTSNMGRNLRNAVYLLEQEYGKEQLSFLTLTLPNLSQEELALICSNWDTITHDFFLWLRKKLLHKLPEFDYAYCTEIQPGRLKNRGEYAPHLHIVFRGKTDRKADWAVSPLECRLAWAVCIRKWVNREFDTRALENLQSIRKSAARYIGKYLSKESNRIPDKVSKDTPIVQLRTHWGGMARRLSRLVKKHIVRLSGVEPESLAQRIYSGIHKLKSKGLIRYWKSRFIQTGRDPLDPNPRGISVGSGCLATPTFRGGLIKCLEFLHSENKSNYVKNCDNQLDVA